MTLSGQITGLGRQARAASRQVEKLTTADKNAALLALAGALVGTPRCGVPVRVQRAEPRVVVEPLDFW